MRHRSTLVLLILSVLATLSACRSTCPTCPAGDAAPAAPLASTGNAPGPRGWDLFGEGVPQAPVLALADVARESNRYSGQNLVIEGEVADVCQRMGCWMVLRDGTREMRVVMHDHGFFVPKDIQGRRARVAGVFTEREIPVEEARHLLEDQGRHEEAMAVTAPGRGFVCDAAGVALAPR